MSCEHWGEIPEPRISDAFIPDVTDDIKKSMDECCLDEYPDDNEINRAEHIVLPQMDPLVMYAISLHKYMNDMTEMIRVAELATEVNLIAPEDAKPPMPALPEVGLKHRRNCLNFIPKNLNEFSSGKEVEVPKISEAVLKKLLEKCVAVMFAHIGFETTHESVMNVLSDVLDVFLKKLCTRLVEAMEEEENGASGFPHYIERVFTEFGLGGVKGLHDYYQNRVIKYINVLKIRCKALSDHYESLLVPKNENQHSEIGKYYTEVKVKEEVEAADENSEAPHFSGDNEFYLLDLFGQLNSYEGESNINTVQEAVESEEVTSSSPGVVFVTSESDVSNLSPYHKKKKIAK